MIASGKQGGTTYAEGKHQKTAQVERAVAGGACCEAARGAADRIKMGEWSVGPGCGGTNLVGGGTGYSRRRTARRDRAGA